MLIYYHTMADMIPIDSSARGGIYVRRMVETRNQWVYVYNCSERYCEFE